VIHALTVWIELATALLVFLTVVHRGK
jgi:hypothetical protein